MFFKLYNNQIVKDENLDKEKQQKIVELQNELYILSQDIIQDIAGEVVPNIEERKNRFIEAHNQLRVLLGKDERLKK